MTNTASFSESVPDKLRGSDRKTGPELSPQQAYRNLGNCPLNEQAILPQRTSCNPSIENRIVVRMLDRDLALLIAKSRSYALSDPFAERPR